MGRIRLTKRIVDAAEYSGNGRAPCILWDAEIPGFGLRVHPGGAKAYVLDYRHEGKRHRVALGRHGVVTVDEAREEARRRLAAQTLSGEDPGGAGRAGWTVKDLIDWHAEGHLARLKTGEREESRLRRWPEAWWGGRRLAEVTPRDAAELHRAAGERGPVEANRVLEATRRLFGAAVALGLLAENPIRVRRFREVPRQRYVTAEEMPRLIAAVEAYPNPWVRGAVWLYLLTGLRASELLERRWEDVDERWGVLRLGETKAGEPQLAPLSPAALEVLRQLPRTTSPYLFATRWADSPRRLMVHHWPKIRAAAGIPDVTLHDLRRTVGAWMAQGGASLRLIAEVLRHKDPSTTARVYSPFAVEPVRAALEAHGRRLLEVGKA